MVEAAMLECQSGRERRENSTTTLNIKYFLRSFVFCKFFLYFFFFFLSSPRIPISFSSSPIFSALNRPLFLCRLHRIAQWKSNFLFFLLSFPLASMFVSIFSFGLLCSFAFLRSLPFLSSLFASLTYDAKDEVQNFANFRDKPTEFTRHRIP